MILVIDNYDSFTYNLFQSIARLESKLESKKARKINIIRNDELRLKEIVKLKPSLIVLSPGPKAPKDAGVCLELIRFYKIAESKPVIFGVCLGHQAIAQGFGATITYAKTQMHGESSLISFDENSELFRGLDSSFLEVGRYHSLIVTNLPKKLKATAYTNDSNKEIMALESRDKKFFGVQFHPESILTPYGDKLISNILQFSKDTKW